MIIFVIFVLSGYLFFKYMWPMLKNNDPKNRPTEVYGFYDKHPKLLVLTIILALFGIGEFFNEIFGTIFGFIFVHCSENMSGGTIGMMCWIKNGLGFV